MSKCNIKRCCATFICNVIDFLHYLVQTVQYKINMIKYQINRTPADNQLSFMPRVVFMKYCFTSVLWNCVVDCLYEAFIGIWNDLAKTFALVLRKFCCSSAKYIIGSRKNYYFSAMLHLFNIWLFWLTFLCIKYFKNLLYCKWIKYNIG